ncbi:glycosyl hydrolase family 28 protein [Pontiellaceae bacterium B1224]|nr:glycosyl hydrolase family 28 protein [Pontiellaceae bacterium B1224]
MRKNTSKQITILLALGTAFLNVVCSQVSAAPACIVHPAPDGIELSTAFSVNVEGQTVPVYKTKVPPGDQIPRLSGSRKEFGFTSLASFDMASPVEITVTSPDPVESVKILPTSFATVPKVDGHKITFTLNEPRHLTVEVNGDWSESLHLFANPFEKNIPDPSDPNVIYFGPGIHEVTNLTVSNNTTIYLAGGAYVRGVMQPDEEPGPVGLRTMLQPTFTLSGTNISFRGRGIVDQAEIAPRSKRRYSLIVHDSENVEIEGVIFLDPSRWTVPIKRSSNVHVDNIKIIGWRGNSDGVDISSSQNVLVENCFLRTLDDLVVVKSRTGQGESKNIHVRNCVLWNELAHALSIGAELRENVSQVLFEDCDIIHDVGRETALRIYHCDSGTVSDITFQNIRVEEARRLISCWIGTTRWTKTPERGHIKNVLFKDITATSAPIDPSLTGFQDGTDWKPYVIKDHASMELIGYDADHLVENVVFDNVVLDGKKVEAHNVTTNAFVKAVEFK